jgi:hypothetical protein
MVSSVYAPLHIWLTLMKVGVFVMIFITTLPSYIQFVISDATKLWGHNRAI